MNGPRKQPKRHHFVPEMLQKRFTDSEGRIFYFDRKRRDLGVRRSTPGQLFVEGHLYSSLARDGTKDTTLEEWFARLESEVDKIVEKIATHARLNQFPNLLPGEIWLWNLFFYMQWKRVPDLHRGIHSDQDISDSLDRLIEKIRTVLPKHSSQLDEIQSASGRKRMIQNVRVEVLWSYSEHIEKLLSERGLAIMRIPLPNKSFVIGSQPVVKLGSSDLQDPSSEIWLPIASDVVVGLGNNTVRNAVYKLANHNDIRRINSAIVAQSSVFAARSELLVKSLASPR